jgi:hypothetical protein
MNYKQLNFSTSPNKRLAWKLWTLIVLSAAGCLFISSYVETLRSETTLIENRVDSLSFTPVKQLLPAEEKYIESVIKQLNVPWTNLLASLETVSQKNPDIHLLSITPDVRQHEVLLSGQVSSLDKLLGYISALQAQSEFDYVWPLSQQTEGDSLQFTLALEWRNE